jgi:hypothetical protein
LRILFYADVHCRDSGSFLPFNRLNERGLTGECENLLKGYEFLRDMIIEHKPDMVIDGGDATDVTEFQSARTLFTLARGHTMIRSAVDKVGCGWEGIPGQHDMINEEHMITNMEILKPYLDMIHLEPTVASYGDIKIGYIPFCTNTIELQKTIWKFGEICDVLVTHTNYKGCAFDSGKISESKLEASDKVVTLSGDIHLRQKVGMMYYPGSLIQNKFNRDDLSGAGGVIIFDTETKKVEFIQNSYSRHYVRVKDLTEFLKNPVPADRCVLKVVTELSYEEVKSEIPGYDFITAPPSKMSTDEAVEYTDVALEDPISLASEWILKENPDALDLFTKNVGGS